MFELYVNHELFGIYSSRQAAANHAFEILIDGDLWTFEIVEVPSTPNDASLSA